MADLDDIQTEIAEFLSQEAARDKTLVGLVFVAREIGEKLDLIDANLFRIALGIEKLVQAALQVSEREQ